MSMLAERKRKTKWVINPTKKPLWMSDLNGIKFGKELMEKMGWCAGKGLGINEQGIQEPLRVSYKNDTKGMGFKLNDNDWIEQQNEFNAFLSQLRNGDDGSNALNVSEKKIKSLVEKSKLSKARVHYQKFTRGKDLSRYSENDLACILGTNKTKEKSKSEEVNKNESKDTEKCETSFGVTTINSGSLQDYFKKKWIFDKNSSSSVQNAENNEIPCQSYYNTESSFTVKNEKNLMITNEEKYKKRKYKSHYEEKLVGVKTTNYELDESESFQNIIKKEKKNKKIKNNLEEPKAKKQKKYCDFNVVTDEILEGDKNYFGNIMDSSKESESWSQSLENKDFSLVNKRKRNQQHLILNSEKNIDCIVEKKKKKSHENFVSDGLPLSKTNIIKEKENILEEELIKVKTKKKSKKEKLEESDGVSDNENVSVNNQTGVDTGPTVENSSVKNKKKKASKEKMGNNEKIEINEFNVIPNGESNEEKSIKLHTTEALEINSAKQKKKKNCNEQEETGSIHVEEELEEKKIAVNEKESEIKAEFVKKKKKKKDKEKKAENINFYSNHTEESSLVEASEQKNDENYEKNFAVGKKTKKMKKKKLKLDKKHEGMNYCSDLRVEFNSRDKITDEVIITTDPQENLLEVDSGKKKKQRKKKIEEKDINCNGLIEELGLKDESSKKNISVSKQDYKLEIKLVKDKNKNKVKEGNEKCGYIEETLQKKNRCKNEDEFIVKTELAKKKKKKVEEGSQKRNYPHECTEKSNSEAPEEKHINANKEQNSLDLELFKDNNEKKERVCKNEEKTQVDESIKKPSIEAVNKRVNFSTSRNIEFHSAINDTMEGHKGVHKHKVAFLNEKTADKFYPGGYDRVLRLLFLSNIAGFKGSNLEGIAGYGQRKKFEGNKSR